MPKRCWNAIVKAVGAKRVAPIHCGNFYLPLDVAPVPSPGFDKTMDAVITRGKQYHIDIRLPVEWNWMDPLGGLARWAATLVESGC